LAGKDKIRPLSFGLWSRRRFVCKTRRIIGCSLVKDHGIKLSEVARYVGFFTSAASKIIGSEIN